MNKLSKFNNIKKSIIIFSVLLITACTPYHEDAKSSFELPEALSDCSVTYLKSSSSKGYTVFRCPLSDTTTVSNGKSKKNITVSEYYPQKNNVSNTDKQIIQLIKNLNPEQKKEFLITLQEIIKEEQ